MPGNGPGLQAIRCTVPAVTVRRAATTAMALASTGWPVRVRTQIIHSGVARPTAPIGRAWRQIGGTRAVAPTRTITLSDYREPPTRFAGVIMPHRQPSAVIERDCAGWLPGREVERFGMGAAVVFGQGLADGARGYATVWWQTWQRVTGRRVTVTGKRRESGDLLICFRHATPSG